ncbi:MAG: hypothetical protein K2I86_01540, partial [Prevotella sp.]|nr:hypothetical protein [Prevotella sp.]
SKIIVINYTTMITINGEQQVFTGSRSSNELPVMAGNEIEIIASFDDNAVTSNICFTMPDGSMQTVTKANPSCKWTVPSNFSSGDKINAQWADESGKIQHQDLTSSIVLIAIEN